MHPLLPVLLLASMAVTPSQDKDTSNTVKVFILAGQSNMEGKAPNALLDHQADDPKTKDLFAHLRKDDKWIVRDDVFIKYLDRKGGLDDRLRIARSHRRRTGIRHGHGQPLRRTRAADQDGLGRALAGQRLPLAVGRLPSDETLQAELDQAQQRVERNNEKRKQNDPLPTMDDIKKRVRLVLPQTCWPK